MTTTESTTQDRETIRQMLEKRYRGAVPVTDEMIDMILAGLANGTAR